MFYYSETVRIMYDDDEADRLYLGKPFEDGTEHLYGGLVDLITFSDEEIRRLFLGLPLMSKLINVECMVGE
jgi:hypothetical protein